MKKALLVIDMQNDYLYEKRKAKFSYDTENLVNSVNSLIEKYHGENSDVIYIRHIIQNLPTNRLLFGYSIAGTEGAEIFSGIKIVSEHCYDKLLGDALTNKKLLSMIKEKKYDVLHLCGLDECGCVTSTALGAAKRGIKAEIIQNGTATVFDEKKVANAHGKLKKADVKFI